MVAERHTGSGLTKEDIIAQHINIPIQDYLPISLEEKVICFADKFFSKSKPTEQLTLEHIRQNMLRFGEASFNRWLALEKLCISNNTP
ncbi:MAG: phosphohydrolase, partial [Paludibacteraceae bacterium]|nr:phosphohydrolase [Paludibacteraceae bacterium]